jgi:hypothetical protein
MKGVVYCYNINSKYYVGKTYGLERKRKDKHKFEALTKNSDTPFARAIRKYGWEYVSKSYEVLEYVYSDSKKELNYNLIELENKHIKEKKSLLPNGYNVKFSNHKECPEIRDKSEIYSKISKSLKGKYLNEEYSSKKIICIELNKEYPSISECARELNLKVQSICNVLKRKQVTCGGYTFKYIDGENPRGNIQKKKVLCIELNREFESMKDASEYFTGSRNQHSNISSAIKRNGTFRGYNFKYII